MTRARSKAKKVQAESYVYKSPVAKTKNQQRLLDAIKDNLIIFAIGCAGTGKTFLSVGCAIEHYYGQMVSRIIISRPTVDAGISIGALPGSAEDKLNPYLQPIFDAKEEFINPSNNNQPYIEVAPINFIRGRTFKDAFVIIDEAQNLTYEQLVMVLTRFGEGSKLIITGDITQSDLNPKLQGGLQKIIEKLEGVELLSIIHLSNEDVVRHPIVAQILQRL